MAQNSIGNELNNLLITHDFDVAALSTKTGKPAVNKRGVPDASEADMFKFDWIGPTGKNYGTVVILLDQNGGMTMYFGDNLGRTMDPEDKKAWYGDSETNSPGFLEQLKHFAIRTSKIRGGFSLEDLSKLKYAIAGQAALTESFYGTKKVSYSGKLTDARLMIKHSRPITEGDKRYRYVESLFIETAEGECFRLPFRKLAGGRAMLEHVRQGGNPYDMRGQHIVETVNQINVLSQFRRAHQGRVFEGAAGELVTETNQYYQQLNQNLKHMANGRGYNRYFESWKPGDISDSDMVVEDLRSMFIETRIDPRIETALPMLAKIQKETQAMKEADIFESWAARLVEGTWALPDTPEKMSELKTWMSEPKPLGPDAEDVTDVLYELIGDDSLFDQLQGMAEEDATMDAVPIVQAWVTRNQDLSPTLAELANSFQTAAPAEPAPPAAPVAPAAPAAPAPAALPVAEGSLNEFAPGSDGGESGRWYTDDEMTDIVGDGWWQDMDVSGANIGVIDSEVPKEYMIQQAQAWLDDQGYSVDVLNCRVNDDDMEWYIEGTFYNPQFAKKGVAEGSHEEQVARLAAYNEKMAGENPPIDLGLREVGNWAKVGHHGDPIKTAWLNIARYGVRNNRFKDSVDQVMSAIGEFPDLEDEVYDMYDINQDEVDILYNAYETVYDQWEQSQGDNLSTFESLQGIKHLAGLPIKESRVEESSEYTYEKIGQTLAQQQPHLDANSDKFAHAVYHEMIELGMTPKSANFKLIYDEDFLSDVASAFHHYVRHGIDEAVPTIAPTSTPAFGNDPATPMNECNYTMENEYCPVHGLEECYGTGMFESELARMKALLK